MFITMGIEIHYINNFRMSGGMAKIFRLSLLFFIHNPIEILRTSSTSSLQKILKI